MDPDSLRWTGVWPNNFSDRNPCKSLTNPDLYYYGLRFYSPEISRWLNKDPIGEHAGLNLYAYVDNCPAQRHDAVGRASGNADEYGYYKEGYDISTYQVCQMWASDIITWYEFSGNGGQWDRCECEVDGWPQVNWFAEHTPRRYGV